MWGGPDPRIAERLELLGHTTPVVEVREGITAGRIHVLFLSVPEDVCGSCPPPRDEAGSLGVDYFPM